MTRQSLIKNSVQWSPSITLTALIRRSKGCSTVFNLLAITDDAFPCAASGPVNSASKGEADIPGVPIARDCAGPDTAVV